MLSREECLAYLKSAVENPPAVPPLREWVTSNLPALSASFDRRDFLALKYRGLVGAYTVLERLGLIEHRDRIFDPLDFGQTHCDYCGADLFWALPGQTSRNEIRRFAKQIKNDQIAADGWIHPGVYCRNGCINRLFHFSNQGLWDKLESERKLRESASITVESTAETLSNFKIYLDRNIRRTAPRDSAPPGCEYIELEPV